MATDDLFIESLNDFLEYPRNLLQNETLSHTINAYYRRLNQRDQLFQEKAAVNFLDLKQGAADSHLTRIESIESLKVYLGEAWKSNRCNPLCRFM